MGLSSWIQNLLARPKAPVARSPREDFIQLYLNRLEDRRVLNADFALAGGDLVLNNFSPGESLDIEQSGGNYLFVLNDGMWTDLDADPNTSGDGTDTLSVSEDLVTDGTIQNLQITDPADNDLGIEFVGNTDFSALGGSFDILGAGDITQTGGTQVEVSTLDVDAASLELNETGNDFGSVTINVSGAASLQDANDLTLGTVSTGDAFQVTTAGVITLTDDINTDSNTNGGDVTLTGDVLLAADVAIDTDSADTDGGVTVSGTINADAAANNRILTITSGDGDVDLQDDLGATQALASLEINSASGTGAITLGNIGSVGTAGAGSVAIGNNDTSSVNFQGTQYVTSSSQIYRAAAGTNFQMNAGAETTFQTTGTAGADPIEFRGSGIQLSTDTDLNVETAGGTDDEILLNQGLQGQLNENVTLNAIRSEIGGISDVQSLTVTGTAQLNGDITTSASTANSNFVQFNDAFAVATAATIDTSAADGNIVFADLADANGEDFTLTAGAGTITVTQLGRLSTDRQFNDLMITADTFNFSVGLFTHAQAGDAGDIAITANAINVTGAAVINTTIDDSGNTDDGTLTVNGPVNADGQMLTVNVGTTDLNLTDAGNDFGTLLVTANNGTIVDADEIQLGTTTLAGNYSVTAGGAITEAASPGLIDADGNLTLAVDGDLGASGSGSLDVQVGGSASLTATGSNVFIESDEDLVISHLETAAAEADTVEITTTGTANLTLQVAAADFLNLETDDMTLTTEDGELAIQGDPLATGAITLVNTGTAGSVTLATDLQTDGGDIDLQNAPSVTIAENVILDTESDDDGNAGSVLFSAASGAAINAAAAGVQSLTVNTTSSGGTDGNVNLSDIGTGIRLGDLNVTAGDGTITLNDTSGTADLAEILTDNGNVTFGSFTELTADTTVDTLGGDLDWQATEVFSDANGPHNLTIQTGGGNVDLGRLTDGPASTNFVNNLVIDTTNGTAGTLTLHGDITLANNFQYTGGAATLLNAGSSSLGLDSSITTLGTGTVEISATSGAASDIVMQDGTTITTTDGDATLEAADNVELSRVLVGGANIAGITAGGAITDADTADDTNPNISAASAGLMAGTGIGAGLAGDGADLDTDVGTIAAVTDTGDINLDEADDLTIGIVGGVTGLTITNADAVMTDDDDITVFAGGDLMVNNSVANNDAGDVTLTAENTNDLFVNADIDAIAPGNITLEGQNVTVTGATVEIMGMGTIATVDPRNGPLTGKGILTIVAPESTTVGAGSTLRTGGGVIQITTDDIDINATASVEADATNDGVVIIRNSTDGRNIELGGSTLADVLGITDVELDVIQADSLRIGRLTATNDAGNITFTAGLTADSARLQTVQLFAGGNITQANGAASFQATNIGIETEGMVAMTTAANNAEILAIEATDGIQFRDLDDLTVGTINDAVDAAEGQNAIGVQSADSFVELITDGGNLIVSDTSPANDISAGGVNSTNNLAINLVAALANAFINVTPNANITSTDGAHRYTADNMDIQGTITATGQAVNLRNANAGVEIDLGDDTDTIANNTLELSKTELNTITTNLLAIGRNTGNMSGDISVTDSISPDNSDNSDTLHLITPGTVIDLAAGAIVETNLLIEAAGGATLDNLVSNDIDTLAAIVTGNGASFEFQDVDSVTVGTVDRLTVTNDVNEAVGTAAFSGIDTDGGDVRLITNTGVTVDQTVNTTADDGGRDSGSIAIDVMDPGDIEINAPLVTTGTTTGAGGEGGDITLTTANGNIANSAAGDLDASGGAGTVDGGDVEWNAEGEITMADGSVINVGTGTVLLQTTGTGGGNITLGLVQTSNATTSAVTIMSNASVLDTNDAGASDIIADAAGSRINITAVDGVGTSGNALETSGVRFDVNNTSTGLINITNTVDNLNVEIDRLSTTGQGITFDNNDLDGLTPGLLTILSTGTGVVSENNGGSGNDITIATDGELTIAAPLDTQGGTGGTFTLTGGATFTPPDTAILLGTGDIDLQSGVQDILIDNDLTIDGGPARFFAPRDIIVSARLSTTGANGVLLLSADNTGPLNGEVADGSGGVLVQNIGEIVSSGDLTIKGSDLAADGLGGGIENGVHIERDAADQVQLTAQDDLTLQNRPGFADTDIVLGGEFGSQNGSVLIDANDSIFLADDTIVSSPNNVAFGDATGRDPVIDDGVIGTPSNLVVNSSGITTFFGRVDGIDSLTTNTGGQTRIRGGLVSTVGSQTYNDAVLINADTPLFDTTTFAAGGDVNFNSTVDGLNPGASDDLILNVTGTTRFNGVVGGSERIGDGTGRAITVNSIGETFFNGPVFTQSGILQNDPAGRITFRQDVNIDAGNVGSDFLADVTLDNVTLLSNGNLTFGSGTVNTDELLIEVGSVLDTSLTSQNITINSRVLDPAVGVNQDLTLNLDTGNLLVNGSVGDAGTNNRFGNFVIVNAGNFLFGPNRMQSLFADSLIQQTGSGSTQLSSTVNVDDVEGVTIATAGVIYDAHVFTNGQRALTQASGSITYTTGSSLATSGGAVVSDAAGDIVMQETGSGVATIDADGGMVVLQSAGNLTMSQIRSEGGFVALTSTNGAVLDAGDQSGLAGAIGSNDVQASQLRIQAANGIATAGNLALETMVSNFDADNGSNGVQIVNTGDLVLGGVSGTFAQTLRSGIPTGIGLPPLNGVSTDDGQIVIRTDGTLTFAPGAVVESGTGRILQPTPMVTNVRTPLIDNDGIAVLSFDLGLPGETNFTAIIDWGDGSPPDIEPGLAGGQNHTFEHQFEENPDPNNPGADIRILLVVMNDPNIQLFGNNGGSLVTPDPPLPRPSPGVNDLVIAGTNLGQLGVFTAIPAFPVTVINITPAVMIEEEELPPFFIPSISVEAPPEESEDPTEEAEDLDLSGSDAEEEDEEEIVVRLRVLSPAGQKLHEYEIDSVYLTNPAPLWARLPDGRYQIVVEEAGESIPVVLRDVEIRQHKVIRRFDRSRRGPDDQTSRLDNPDPTTSVSDLNVDGAELPIEAASARSEQTESDPPIARSRPDAVWENWQRPPKSNRISPLPEEATTESDADSEDQSPLITSAAAAGIVLGLRRRRTDRSADQQMTRFSPRAISPAARLRRRLRKSGQLKADI